MNKSKIISLKNPADLEPCAVQCAEALQKKGCVLLIPTETVYGLVCRWDDQAAIDRIYELKDRDRSKKLAMFASNLEQAMKYKLRVNSSLKKLVEQFCPGAITVIGSKVDSDETLGLRIPDHQLVLRLLELIDFPLASTSANLSGQPNARQVNEALSALHGSVDLAVDQGEISPDAQASTVVNTVGNTVKVLRPGPITEAQIMMCLSQQQ